MNGWARKLLWWPIPGRDVLESSFQNSIQHTFAGMELALKEQVPNLGAALVGQLLTNVRGFPIPVIQKSHMKRKRRSALVKDQARNCTGDQYQDVLCWNLIPRSKAKTLEEIWSRKFWWKSGFHSIPEIQKYHIKGKRRGALVKGRARKLLW